MLIVMFDVASVDAGAVMAALAPVMALTKDFRMEVKDDITVAVRVGKGSRKGKCSEALLEVLAKGPATKDMLQKALADIGLSPNSASPSLTVLRRNKLVDQNTDGRYELRKVSS